MDMRGSSSRRPARVIILDADDPMIEIEGRVVWQEAHELIVAEAREAAFREGYNAALREQMARPTLVVRYRRRRTVGQWFALIVLATIGLIFLLMLPVLLQK